MTGIFEFTFLGNFRAPVSPRPTMMGTEFHHFQVIVDYNVPQMSSVLSHATYI